MPLFTSANATLQNIDGAGTSVLNDPGQGGLPSNGISGFADLTRADATSGILIQSGAHLTIRNQIVVTDRIAVSAGQAVDADSLTLINSVLIITGDRSVTSANNFPTGFTPAGNVSSFTGRFNATNSSMYATAQPNDQTQYTLFRAAPVGAYRFNFNGFTIGASYPENFVGGTGSPIPGFDCNFFELDVANSVFTGFNTADGAVNNGVPRGYRSAKQTFSRYGINVTGTIPSGTDPRGLLSVFLLYTSGADQKHYLVQPDFSNSTGTSTVGGDNYVSGIRAQGANTGATLLMDAPIFPSNTLPYKRDNNGSFNNAIVITNPYRANHVDNVGSTVDDVIMRFTNNQSFAEAAKQLATNSAPVMVDVNTDVTNADLANGYYLVATNQVVTSSTTMDLTAPTAAIPFRRWSFTGNYAWQGNNIETYQVTGVDGVAVTYPGTPLADAPTDFDNDIFATTTTISGSTDAGVGAYTATTAPDTNAVVRNLDDAYASWKRQWYDLRRPFDYPFSVSAGNILFATAGGNTPIVTIGGDATTNTVGNIQAMIVEDRQVNIGNVATLANHTPGNDNRITAANVGTNFQVGDTAILRTGGAITGAALNANTNYVVDITGVPNNGQIVFNNFRELMMDGTLGPTIPKDTPTSPITSLQVWLLFTTEDVNSIPVTLNSDGLSAATVNGLLMNTARQRIMLGTTAPGITFNSTVANELFLEDLNAIERATVGGMINAVFNEPGTYSLSGTTLEDTVTYMLGAGRVIGDIIINYDSTSTISDTALGRLRTAFGADNVNLITPPVNVTLKPAGTIEEIRALGGFWYTRQGNASIPNVVEITDTTTLAEVSITVDNTNIAEYTYYYIPTSVVAGRTFDYQTGTWMGTAGNLDVVPNEDTVLSAIPAGTAATFSAGDGTSVGQVLVSPQGSGATSSLNVFINSGMNLTSALVQEVAIVIRNSRAYLDMVAARSFTDTTRVLEFRQPFITSFNGRFGGDVPTTLRDVIRLAPADNTDTPRGLENAEGWDFNGGINPDPLANNRSITLFNTSSVNLSASLSQVTGAVDASNTIRSIDRKTAYTVTGGRNRNAENVVTGSRLNGIRPASEDYDSDTPYENQTSL